MIICSQRDTESLSYVRSVMTYNFRNREHIKAPSRLEDPEDEPRQVSYKEPDIDYEMYASPRSLRAKYHGPVIPYNPDLRPATFPTLDPVRQARPVELETIDLDTPSISEEEGTQATADKTKMTQNDDVQQEIIQTHISTHISSEKAPVSSLSSPHETRGAVAWKLHHTNLQPRHDWTSASIMLDNLRRIEYAASMNAFDRNLLAMTSSEDEDDSRLQEQPTTRQMRKQEVLPEWRDLTAAHKLQLFDIVQDAYPREEWAPLLRLEEPEIRELVELINERNRRFFKEQAAGNRHRKETQQKLLRGAIMNEERFRRSLEQTIYRSRGVRFHQEDFDISKPSDLERAKAYLCRCQLNPKLLDGAWATVPAASAANLERVQNVTPGFLASDRLGRNGTGLIVNSDPDIPDVIQHTRVNASDNVRSPSEDLSPLAQTIKSGNALHLRPPSASSLVGQKQTVREQSGHLPPRLINHHQEHPTSYNRTTDHQSMAEEGAVATEESSPKTPTRAKGLISPDLETDFLTHERRPGARQPKPTEKVVQAEATALIQAMSVRKRKRRGPRRSDQSSGGPDQSSDSFSTPLTTPTDGQNQNSRNDKKNSVCPQEYTTIGSDADEGKRGRNKSVVLRGEGGGGPAETPHFL